MPRLAPVTTATFPASVDMVPPPLHAARPLKSTQLQGRYHFYRERGWEVDRRVGLGLGLTLLLCAGPARAQQYADAFVPPPRQDFLEAIQTSFAAAQPEVPAEGAPPGTQPP